MRSASRLLRSFTLAALLSIAAATSTLAVEPGERLADPALESRARALSTELRCLVCQNQSIDDSNAPLAKDLRLLVRERISAGDNDKDVLKFIVARYGDFVLLRPPFNLMTLILWVTPLLALIVGVIAFRRSFAAPGDQAPADQPLSPSEQRRLDELLRKPDDKTA